MATKRVRSALPGNPGTLRAELTLRVTDGILSEVENRTPRSVRRLHGHRPLIPTVERRSGSGHLSPAQGVRPSGWRSVHRNTPWSAKALTREVRPELSRCWPVFPHVSR